MKAYGWIGGVVCMAMASAGMAAEGFTTLAVSAALTPMMSVSPLAASPSAPAVRTHVLDRPADLALGWTALAAGLPPTSQAADAPWVLHGSAARVRMTFDAASLQVRFDPSRLLEVPARSVLVAMQVSRELVTPTDRDLRGTLTVSCVW